MYDPEVALWERFLEGVGLSRLLPEFRSFVVRALVYLCCGVLGVASSVQALLSGFRLEREVQI